ncbi:MAG: 50S ribosomal protein L10 [Thermoprotei archaeon]|nr:MAG: 50S ribosomal protein L10 [Thermoprotei archaeon]
MYVRQKTVPKEKIERVKQLAELFRKYNSLLIVNITGVTAPVLHEVRAKLREKGSVLRVVKNTLAKFAIDQVSKDKKGIVKLKEYLEGQNAIIFTNENVFALKLFLDKNKIARDAKAGDVAQDDIVIPSGNTNLAPGPVLSLFNKLKVPTNIREGSIWVAKDTVVAKAGDVISADLADLLKKLGIKPIKVGLSSKIAYADGVIIPKELLEIDLDAVESEIKTAVNAAFNLALNAGYLTVETAPIILRKAYIEAFNLSVNAAYPTKETLPLVLSKAQLQAETLNKIIESKIQ